MKTRRKIGILWRAAGIALCVASSALAQTPLNTPNAVGVWRGTSVCLVRPSACKDETVVYRITRVNAGDSLSVDALKVVDGREDDMGALSCRFVPASARVTCAMPNGLWQFTILGDSLTGELRLPDNRKFRDVRARRDR